jgi:hypothetical protein
MLNPQLVEFDLDRYLRNSKKVDLSGVDWHAVPDHPLSEGDVMSLHYMMDIETHTVIYLRDLLVTRVAADPQITAFLSCWVYEELWHGEAFSDFLRAYGLEERIEPKLPDGRTPLPTRPNRWRDLRVRIGVGNGLGIVPTMIGSMAARDFAAIHMMWGAVNELTTLRRRARGLRGLARAGRRGYEAGFERWPTETSPESPEENSGRPHHSS